jgi:hypothetical protein
MKMGDVANLRYRFMIYIVLWMTHSLTIGNDIEIASATFLKLSS